MTQDTLTVEEIVDTFLKELKEDFTGGDMHDWEYGKFRLRPLLTNTLTTYGQSRYDDGVKAERERVREWAKEKKEKLTMKWDNDKAKSTVYDSILYGWDGFLDDKENHLSDK